MASWTATLLEQAPISGTVAEHHFDLGADGGSWCWAQFEKEDETEAAAWAGCFRRAGGMSRGDRALAVPQTEDAVVLAGDLVYWVSLRDRLIRFTDADALDVRTVPGRSLVVVAGYSEVRALSATGIVWRRDLFSYDPITLVDAEHDHVTGVVDGMDGPVPFEIDLESMQLRGGIAPPEDDFWTPSRTSMNAPATGSQPPTDQQSTGRSWTAWLWEIATLLFGVLVAVQGYGLYGWTFAGPWLAMVAVRSAVRIAAFSKHATSAPERSG